MADLVGDDAWHSEHIVNMLSPCELSRPSASRHLLRLAAFSCCCVCALSLSSYDIGELLHLQSHSTFMQSLPPLIAVTDMKWTGD